MVLRRGMVHVQQTKFPETLLEVTSDPQRPCLITFHCNQHSLLETAADPSYQQNASDSVRLNHTSETPTSTRTPCIAGPNWPAEPSDGSAALPAVKQQPETIKQAHRARQTAPVCEGFVVE